MIEIKMTEGETLVKSNVHATPVHGYVKIEGDKNLCIDELANVFKALIKENGELFEAALDKALKNLENGNGPTYEDMMRELKRIFDNESE